MLLFCGRRFDDDGERGEEEEEERERGSFERKSAYADDDVNVRRVNGGVVGISVNDGD